MDQNSLVTEETDAGADLISQFDKTFPVQAAFWLKPTEASRWYLYIASDRINDNSIGSGYGEVIRLTQMKPTPYLDPFQVKLIPIDDPLARAAIEFHDRYPGRPATRLRGGTFGGLSIDGAYIYPSPVAAPAG